MRLAERMAHLGTETAFEAAARARALEATGRHIVHLHLGEPDFDTPPNIVEAAARAMASGKTHYSPPPGIPELRAAIAAEFDRPPGRPGERRAGRRGPRREAHHGLRAHGPRGARRRGHRARPGLPHLRIDDRLHGRHPGGHPAAPGERLPPRPRRAARARHAAHPDALLQQPPEPHRRRAHEGGHRGHRADRPRARPGRLRRRDLHAHPLRGRALLDHGPAGDAGAHDRPRRLQQDVRHDRLAPGLRRSCRPSSCRPSRGS